MGAPHRGAGTSHFTEGLICIVPVTYLQPKPPSSLGTSGFLQPLLRLEANSCVCGQKSFPPHAEGPQQPYRAARHLLPQFVPLPEGCLTCRVQLQSAYPSSSRSDKGCCVLQGKVLLSSASLGCQRKPAVKAESKRQGKEGRSLLHPASRWAQ